MTVDQDLKVLLRYSVEWGASGRSDFVPPSLPLTCGYPDNVFS
jgi:hypothetical protein